MATDTLVTADTRPALPDDQRRRLRRLNLIVGLIHLGQAIAILALSRDVSLPVIGRFLTDDPIMGGGLWTEPLFDLPIGPVVAAFLLFAAVDHLLVSSVARQWYERNVAVGKNPARWWEYSISSSLMVVLIAALAGIWDVTALLAIFGANTAMILFGLLFERDETPGEANWSSFWYGTIIGLVPWAAITIQLFSGIGEAPTFVYIIFATLFVWFWTFPINMVLQYRQIGKWASPVRAEATYLWLSLIAKTLLAWQVFGNVLRA